MLTRKPSTAAAFTVLVTILIFAGMLPVIAQQRDSSRPHLSGRWQVNRALSENAEAQLERAQSPQGGHRPPAGLHGLAGLFGGHDETEQAREAFLHRPSSFVVTQDDERIVVTDSNGRVRALTATGRPEKVDGRDVRTTWDKGLLIVETSFGTVTVAETYERPPNASQLAVTTRMAMGGREVSVRRVYDADRAQ